MRLNSYAAAGSINNSTVKMDESQYSNFYRREDSGEDYYSDEDKIDPRVRSFMTEVDKEVSERSQNEKILKQENKVSLYLISLTLI